MIRKLRRIALPLVVGGLLAVGIAAGMANAQKRAPIYFDILVADYGGNCPSSYAPDRRYPLRGNNMTKVVRDACPRGTAVCRYYIDHTQLGDPAAGCPKKFSVNYRCLRPRPSGGYDPEQTSRYAVAHAEASGNTIVFSCDTSLRNTVIPGRR